MSSERNIIILKNNSVLNNYGLSFLPFLLTFFSSPFWVYSCLYINLLLFKKEKSRKQSSDKSRKAEKSSGLTSLNQNKPVSDICSHYANINTLPSSHISHHNFCSTSFSIKQRNGMFLVWLFFNLIF